MMFVRMVVMVRFMVFAMRMPGRHAFLLERYHLAGPVSLQPFRLQGHMVDGKALPQPGARGAQYPRPGFDIREQDMRRQGAAGRIHLPDMQVMHGFNPWQRCCEYSPHAPR